MIFYKKFTLIMLNIILIINENAGFINKIGVKTKNTILFHILEKVIEKQ